MKLIESILSKESKDEQSLFSLLQEIKSELKSIKDRSNINELIYKINQWEEVSNSIIEIENENI